LLEIYDRLEHNGRRDLPHILLMPRMKASELMRLLDFIFMLDS